MASPRNPPAVVESEHPPAVITHQPASPRFPPGTPTSRAHRKIAIAVDLSDESAHAVKWAAASAGDEEAQQKVEDDFDNFTTTKANDVAQPLVDANIPFKIHIVKDHDMKERLCLEVERLGLSAMIMGSRGFGASRRNTKGRLGSVSDYCVHHCVCPVVVVRYPDEKDGRAASGGGGSAKAAAKDTLGLHPVPEEEPIYHDASDKATARGEVMMVKAESLVSLETSYNNSNVTCSRIILGKIRAVMAKEQ
nr:universal stress protein PHOS32-like [Ipomoea batatas]